LIEIKPSIVEDFTFRGRRFYLKRDDLIHPLFSGNKARKFHYFFDKDLTSYQKIISHGSSQSNAMFSLSQLAKLKKLEFDYYCSHLSSYVRDNPHGNYKMALKNGMNIYEGEPPQIFKDNELFVPEGGYFKEAEYGIKILANEIEQWVKDNSKKIDIFLPSGTGTTALYLQKNLKDIKVYTTCCVGDSEYLKKEFFGLCGDELQHPIILNTPKKYHFAKLYKEFYEIYKELKIAGVEFDMLYDPKGWITLDIHKNSFQNDIMYIHQGGILGNITMLKRYERKYN